MPILQHIWSGRYFYLAGQKHTSAPTYGTKTLAGFAEEGNPLWWRSGCKRPSVALLKTDFSLQQLILKCFKRGDSLGAEIKAHRGAGAGFNASCLSAWQLSPVWGPFLEVPSVCKGRKFLTREGRENCAFCLSLTFSPLKTLWDHGVSIGSVHS